jgi:NADPH:quinone reductase
MSLNLVPRTFSLDPAFQEERIMKAFIVIQDPSGGTLELREIPDPKPEPGELLIRVKAAGVNRADLYQRKGTHPAPTKYGSLIIAGLEAVGEVKDIGDGVKGFRRGDRVMAHWPGGYAELVAVNHRLVLPVPERLSWEEAAAIPVSYMTEHDALITNAGLRAKESVLIHAASSGVGVAAVQIARLFGAKPIMGTGGDPGKFDALRSLGMDLGIHYRTQNFADAVLNHTAGAGVDVIIDHVGGPYLKDNLRCLALKGRLVSVGRLGGKAGELDLDFLALRRLHLIGVTFRTRTLEERVAIAERFTREVLPALADGRLKPKIDRVFPFDQALAAQNYLASNVQVGKVVLSVEKR